MANKSNLPRLQKEAYLGQTTVHWTHTVSKRQTGWLSDTFHAQFRETLLHSLVRYAMSCSAYCLMPDHMHVLVDGLKPESDQLLFARRLRGDLNRLLKPFALQRQGHDHVLKDHEREREAYRSMAHYILNNPVRAELCSKADTYPFSGCMFPGYFGLDPHVDGYWDTYWKLYGLSVG